MLSGFIAPDHGERPAIEKTGDTGGIGLRLCKGFQVSNTKVYKATSASYASQNWIPSGAPLTTILTLVWRNLRKQAHMKSSVTHAYLPRLEAKDGHQHEACP
ncbi:hypothetical protein H4Q26_015379 [Puccinia striiformis f. sp. tritici PST-130]|nr:hypothetical protein H4Q26_015379 [Puccinia striiformis f. sp. tritici PST-130]